MSDSTTFAAQSRSQFELPTGTLVTVQKTFRVGEPLGEGGMGKVFKAFDPLMNRYVALKVMKEDVPESEQRRFRREARLCGSFTHANLVRVLDVGTTKERGLFWFTMEFLEGRDIGKAMEGGRKVPLHVVREIVRQVLDALDYVHRRNVVHRDVKPANVFVTSDPFDPQLRPVKLLDFGVARDANDPTPEDAKIVLGDPRFLPPEQVVTNGPLDGRADLYALGMTFYEAITGHHPFEDLFDAHPRELIAAHRERVPELPSTYLRDTYDRQTSERIDKLFAKACAKVVENRFADARAMQRALLEIT